MSADPADPQTAVLAAIWEEHRPRMIERVSVLERAADALGRQQLHAQLESDAEIAAHQLAGAVGTFGFWEASERAREAEAILRDAAVTTPEQASRLAELAVGLRDSLAVGPVADAPGPPSQEEGSPLVLLVDDDTVLTGRLAREAERRGMRVEVAATPAEAAGIAEGERPDAVVLDLTFGDDTSEAMELLAELAARTPPVPVLVLTVRDGFMDRIDVARRGAVGFLEKTLSPSDAMDQVRQVLGRASITGSRVLAVDDDPIVLAMTEATLAARGLEVTTLSDPMRVWDELKRVAPSLVLLDVDMPGASGIELCRVLRNDPRWAAVPVLILTAKADSATIQEVYEAGADDYLVKPVVAGELTARVENRLERFRLHQALADTDALTGLANRRTSKSALSQLVRLANRFSNSLCLAELDLDHFKRVNDRYGHAAGDSALRRLSDLLRRSFRGEDVVARWGGEEFVVGMYGLSRASGVERIGHLLDAFRKEEFSSGGERFTVTFSAGVAQYPTDGEDLEALYRAADEALYRAKGAGRNQVMGAGDPAALPQEVIDVAIIEDEDATAQVLFGALDGHGYRWRRFSDGARAADALCGPSPVTQARVVLLDVNIPALDGFAVLDRMAKDGVLRTSRVLMLTARAEEQEILRALELGAFDHVAKPFSVPVLMQKVRRALER